MTAVNKARFDVETAKLDASKQEIVSKIEGADANLKVADAQQKLLEVEGEVEIRSRGQQAQTSIEVEREQESGV